MAQMGGVGGSASAPGRPESTPWYRRRIVVISLAVVVIAAAVVLGVPYLDGNPCLQRHASTAIVVIKVVHTLAWLFVEVCLLYLLFAGLARRSGRRAGFAAAVVACESLIFAGNGFRCPLTDLAESLGAASGAVVDIYLPAWFANNLPLTHGPVFFLAALLYARNLRSHVGQRAGAAEHETGATGKAAQVDELSGRR